MYVQYKVNVSESQVETLKDTIRLNKAVNLCFLKGGHILLLTQIQITRLDKVQVEGRRARAQIHMRARQVAKSVSYAGGFIGMLALLAARALPTIMTGFTTGLLSGDISEAISGSGTAGDDSLHINRGDAMKYIKVKVSDGLYLAPHPRLVNVHGLFLERGMDISDGASCSWERKVCLRTFPT